MPKTVAIIPAAGKGSRLGLKCPKVFTPLANGVSPWSIIYKALRPLVDHIELVLANPAGQLYKGALADIDVNVGISCQEAANGMGDAVFCADWHDADTIVVVWGDQIGINKVTPMLALQGHIQDRGLTIPMVKVQNPYVEYEYKFNRLSGIRQSREGDKTSPWGWTDVGIFVLSTDGLREAWSNYLTEFSLSGGGVTGEVNLLPFLLYLVEHGWNLYSPLAFPDEARGLNTPEDLEWARERFAK